MICFSSPQKEASTLFHNDSNAVVTQNVSAC